MSLVDVISGVDLVITVGIQVVEIVLSDLSNIITSPSSFTYFVYIWIWTVDGWEIFTTFLSSDIVFMVNKTLVEFISINGVVHF